MYLRHLLRSAPELVCANPEDYGLCTLFRAYPIGTEAKAQFERELTDPAARNELVVHNQLTRAIGDTMWEWFRAGKQINGLYTPYISFSTGFRVTEYNRDATDPEAVIFALKVFPMNVHIEPALMRHVITCVLAARDHVLSNPRSSAHPVRHADPFATGPHRWGARSTFESGSPARGIPAPAATSD
jgi:hypothetical protein